MVDFGACVLHAMGSNVVASLIYWIGVRRKLNNPFSCPHHRCHMKTQVLVATFTLVLALGLHQALIKVDSYLYNPGDLSPSECD